MNRYFGSVGLVLALSAPLLAGQEEPEKPEVRRYELPGHGTLEIRVPAGWKEAVRSQEGRKSPTIHYTPAEGDRFEIWISPHWDPEGSPEYTDPDRIRKLMEDPKYPARLLLKKSKEDELTLVLIQGEQGKGFFTRLTAADPAEKYARTVHGIVGVKDLLINFTVQYRGKPFPVEETALEMVRSIRREEPEKEEGKGGEVSGTGTVVWMELEGGFFGLRADDGKKYLPMNLPEKFRRHGTKIEFKGKVRKDVVGFQMWGTALEILRAEPVEEKND